LEINPFPEESTPLEETKKEERSGWSSFLLETLQTIILAIVLYFLIDTVIARVRVENISMLPTLQPGEFILVDKISFHFKEAEYGDIVVFHFPQNPREDYIKRVIGLPGDHVRIANEKIYINEYEITEAYLAAQPAYEGEWTVPEEAYFVLGDNRNQSSDSHSWGFVPKENVIGKALIVYWPFDELKLLTQPDVVFAAH
jgi:signal peptidase I